MLLQRCLSKMEVNSYKQIKEMVSDQEISQGLSRQGVAFKNRR